MNPEEIQKQIRSLEGMELWNTVWLILTHKSELSKKDVPNMNVLVEYDQKCKLYQARAQQLEEVNKERLEKTGEYDLLKKERLEKFMDGFTTISKYLKEIYQVIFSHCRCLPPRSSILSGIIFFLSL